MNFGTQFSLRADHVTYRNRTAPPCGPFSPCRLADCGLERRHHRRIEVRWEVEGRGVPALGWIKEERLSLELDMAPF